MVSIAGDSKASADAPLSTEGEGEGGVESGKGEFAKLHQSTVVDEARFVWGVVSVVDAVVFV